MIGMDDCQDVFYHNVLRQPAVMLTSLQFAPLALGQARGVTIHKADDSIFCRSCCRQSWRHIQCQGYPQEMLGRSAMLEGLLQTLASPVDMTLDAAFGLSLQLVDLSIHVLELVHMLSPSEVF